MRKISLFYHHNQITNKYDINLFFKITLYYELTDSKLISLLTSLAISNFY